MPIYYLSPRAEAEGSLHIWTYSPTKLVLDLFIINHAVTSAPPTRPSGRVPTGRDCSGHRMIINIMLTIR